MYILIKGTGMLMGLFSSMKRMRAVIEESIKADYQKNGYYGNYNFRYIKCRLDEPWFNNVDAYNKEAGRAIFSFHTIHEEYFTFKVETDWTTGKIISMKSNRTTNV